jgi:hypothetical protein
MKDALPPNNPEIWAEGEDMLSPNHRTAEGVCRVWRDRASGLKVYFVSVAQTLPEMMPWVLFTNSTGAYFALPADEFHDGRFTPVWEAQ